MKIILLIALLLPTLAIAQFTTESELGYISSGGNANLETTNAKTVNKYSWDKYKTTFGGHYTYGETSDSVTVRNWDLNGKLERVVHDRLSVFFGEVIEGNTFVGIKGRYNSDIGAKYYYIKSDAKNFFTELGYRYAVEDRYSPLPDTFDNKARLYNEFNQKVSETFQYTLWLEYIPNFTDGRDYLVNGEASLLSILTSVLSLKVAYKGMYDNLPANRTLKNYDHLTTTSLVMKF
jgi:putative salt-induced outer membrane protein